MKTDYLRISITDRCNLRCIYCHPFNREFIPHKEILRFEEIVRVVGLLSFLGIKTVRITGGEPLIKRDIEHLIRMVKDIPGVEEVNMTTNGVLLGEKYDALIHAGLDRVNVSLNTLKRERYKRIMGADCLMSVLEAIKQAGGRGPRALKVNTILFRGINDDEIVDFVNFAIQHDICVRFIEYYSTNSRMRELEKRGVSSSEVRRVIEKRFGPLTRDYGFPDKGPAQTYSISGAGGAVGFISSHAEKSCSRCNRLRLSSDGRLFPCLFSRDCLNVKSLLREKTPRDFLMGEISGLISSKCRYSKKNRKECDFSLGSIGG